MDQRTPVKKPILRGWAPVLAVALVAAILQAAAALGAPSVDDALFAGSGDHDEWLDGGWAIGALAVAVVGLALGIAYEAVVRPSSRWDALAFGALAVPASSPTLRMLASLSARDTEGYRILFIIQMVFFAVPAMVAGGLGAALGGLAMRFWRLRKPAQPADGAPPSREGKP